MGPSSTHPSATTGTPSETGVDTLRLLYEVEHVPARGIYDLPDGWKVQSMPELHLVAAEGNPDGGRLWSGSEVQAVGDRVRELVDGTWGVWRDRGVSRMDVTTSRKFDPAEGRAFMGGMAAMEFPRLEGTRRGSPVHSVWWTGARSAVIKNRVYDESFKVEGREPFERLRLEEEGRYVSGHRPSLDEAADPDFQRDRFLRRFKPMRKAVDGVTAASFPVIAQALADEARYGYRTTREVERLAGALVILGGGGGDGYKRRTRYRRQCELREAGYVVIDDFMDPVSVNLGDELERALEEFGA
jgi:hypothetical protein